jgi:hypothetical protein
VTHRQIGLIDQSLCKMQALSVRDGKRRRANVLREKATQMAARYAKAIGEIFDVAVIEGATCNQPQTSAYGCRRSTPGRGSRSTFRATSQARSEPGLTRRSGTRIERNITAFRGNRRAYGTAVDSRRFYTDKKLTVETCVSR